jgi:hypothetical protein
MECAMAASILTRRTFLACTGIAAGGLGAASAEAKSNPPPQAEFPQLEFVYEATVDIAPLEDVGEVSAGHQRIIPITGGSFEGPNIRGKVVPGAVDWNLVRNDGVTVVFASYFLRTDDGVYIKIVNQGVNPALAPGALPPSRPRFTTPTFEAPKGRYDWLNKSVFVGTLTPGVSGKVRIRVFRLI